ncbi:MAG: gspL [Ramlibacter sp.]|jgi:general secretion pathway protein L|uniref:type II secretion system protein GspL n=1 Tax=Ramlibacter sp. TaxID=1917967 RepID=UPI00262E7271|nr:type II secretion system protein GspL [Ramlibacter sp.]MDB5752944.1 gspL [Ramlibacter sp.]
MSSLIVSLPLEPATTATEWAFALSVDGRTLQDHGSTAAALLPLPRGTGAEVIAVVPVQALSWHRVELPKGIAAGSPRLRSVLEGLLEEQLLDEPDAVHLALQPGARAGEPAWVATCDRAWLRSALQLLESADRPVGRIVPEFAPEGELALVALGDPQRPLVVTSGAGGVVALPLNHACLPLLPELPEDAARIAEPAVAGVAELVLQHKMTLQQAPQRWLQASRTRWDLAQFEFASSGRTRALKKLATGWAEVLHGTPWRPARWGAVALVVVNLLGLNAWAWKERASLDDKRAGVRAALTETFPLVRVVVDAPIQMEREVAALRQLTGVASPRDLDALLAALAAALPADRTPNGLDFATGELRAKGLQLTADQFRSVASQLKALGYAATADGDTVTVTAEDGR